MKKLLILTILTLFLFQGISAINVNIEKLNSSQDTIIKGLGQPAVMDLNVTNLGNKDEDFLFYNLLGFIMEPKEPVFIEAHETKNIQLIIYPRKDLDFKNYLNMQYFVRAQSDKSEEEKKISMKIVELQDAFSVGSEEINPESNSIKIYITNKEKTSLKGLNVKFTSQFFELDDFC